MASGDVTNHAYRNAASFCSGDEPVKTPQGEKTRVRAGPYPTMAAAETGRARLKTLKLLPGGDGKIVLKGE